jgi:hypothetical protein
MMDSLSSTRETLDRADRPAIPLGGGAEEGVLDQHQPELPPLSPSEVIEPGRALALADFARASGCCAWPIASGFPPRR